MDYNNMTKKELIELIETMQENRGTYINETEKYNIQKESDYNAAFMESHSSNAVYVDKHGREY